MLLDVRDSGFHVIFSQNFFPESVTKRYEEIKKLYNLPYKDVASFIRSGIQSVSLPGVNLNIIDQTLPYGKKNIHRTGKPIHEVFDRSFSISYRIMDGWINYFIMLDCLLEHQYWRASNDIKYHDFISIFLLDNYGYARINLHFSKILIKSFPPLELNYTSLVPKMKTFSVSYEYFILKIRYLSTKVSRKDLLDLTNERDILSLDDI